PFASVKAAMSSALPKACSEICAPGWPFMPRHEYAEICLISATGTPNHFIAAGWTPLANQLSSWDTIGQASVAVGLTVTEPVVTDALSRPSGTGVAGG